MAIILLESGEQGKICSNCKIPQPLSNYQSNKSRLDGYQHRCTPCRKEYNKLNRENRKEYDKARREDEDTHSKRLKQRREFTKANSSRLNAIKKEYYENNKPLLLQKQAVYRKTPIGRAVKQGISHRRRIGKKQGDVTSIQLKELYEKSTHCFYCKCNLSLEIKTPHLDHYVPLSKGGLHTISNLVVACAFCNTSKHNMLPEEFIKKNGY